MSDSPQYSVSNVSAGSYWYCRIEDKVIGPLSTGRLRQMARQGKLLPEDDVRLGTIGDWVPADEVVGLFRGIATTTRAEQESAKKGAAATPRAEPANRPSLTAGITEAIADWTNDTIRWITGSFQLLRTVVSWVCLVIVVVTLAALIGRNLSFDWWLSEPDSYETLVRNWSDLMSLRDGDASDTRWNDFVAASKADIEPIAAMLERKAGSRDRYSQQLLWAARDCWPEMLTGARAAPNEAEHRFENHLANAQALKEGRPLYPSASRTGGPAAFDSNIFLRIYGDWLVAGIVLIDGLLILLLIRWWWRRSRNR